MGTAVLRWPHTSFPCSPSSCPFVAVLSLTGCDTDQGADLDPSDIEYESEEPAPVLHPDFDLVSETRDPLASAQVVWQYTSTPLLPGDGDVLMIKTNAHGYLGCDSLGAIQLHQDPSNIDSYIWKVHRASLGWGPADKLQFELIDDTGLTGTYLKMNGSGEVFRGSTTGSGDAAAWIRPPGAFGGVGENYVQAVWLLNNYKQDECLWLNSTAGYGSDCIAMVHALFNFEVIDPAS